MKKASFLVPVAPRAGMFKAVASAVALAALTFGNLAHAAAGDSIDVSGVVAKIDAAVGPIGTIGAAVLLVIVAIAAFKWVRRAIS